MIELFEQYGFKKECRRLSNLTSNCRDRLCTDEHYLRTLKRKNEQQLCYEITFDKTDNDFHFQTSYFVGVDWIDKNRDLKIYVQPKQNKDAIEINYISMLLEALQEPENFNHLEDLIYIDFFEPYIKIEQEQDMLSPFLIAQFLQILKNIVRKGLKKSYYTTAKNLHSRVKGKILVGRNIKENIVKGQYTKTSCQYQEFGINCNENKILKKAYQFSRRVIQNYKAAFDIQPLLQLINYIHPAFENVSEDIDIQKLKMFYSNPLFKEYDQALQLAMLILKRYSYNITKTEQRQIMTPPFWIDMSKLFELYVYKKLRNVFSSDEVKYHVKAKHQELDFIIRSKDNSHVFVVDTKYKPRYQNHNVAPDDIRQISGYARMKKVYDEVKYEHDIVLNCLVIYSHQDCNKNLTKEHFKISSEAETNRLRPEKGYVKFYKLGVGLPEKS